LLLSKIKKRLSVLKFNRVKSIKNSSTIVRTNKQLQNELCPISEIEIESRASHNFRSLCPVKIGGQPAFALIDSGNVVVNAISEKFARELFGPNYLEHIKPLRNYSHVGTAKKGATMKVLGITKQALPLRFGGVSTQFLTNPIVIRGLSMAINISGPFLSEKGIDQLHSRGALRVKGKLVKLVTYQNSQYEKARSDSQKMAMIHRRLSSLQQEPQEIRAYVKKEVTIPPNAAAFVCLRIPEIESGVLNDGEGLLQVSESFADSINGHPVIIAAVRTTKKGQCKTSVLNVSAQSITVPEGKQYGTFHPREWTRPRPSKGCEGSMATLTKPTQSKLPTSLAEKVAWLKEAFELRKAPWLRNDPKMYEKTMSLLLSYFDILSINDEYGKTSLVKHAIKTHDVPPIRLKGKPINPVMQEKLREQMNAWQEQDVIEPSSSPWSFGMIPVEKKNGKLRWVVDYRRLNDVTLKDAYPLPNMEDNLARLANSKVFSSLDAAGAFHACEIETEDREKTAFHTPWGLYQFKSMPFGLCNAPATYSRLVSRVLEDIPTSVALPYLDDICVHSKDTEGHLQALRDVFEAHRKAGLKLQPAKCHLFQDEVDYLGHRITGDGIKPRKEYLEVVEKWPLPNTIKGWRAFLGKAAYYRRFIPRFSHLSAPLYALLSKDNDQDPKNIQAGVAEIRSFLALKKALTSAPLLAYPDFTSESPFILDTDWSKDPGAIGGVLSQVQQGEERVISYGARKLTKAEANYSSNKGELLAVIHFMKSWRYYFQHRPFILRTDHQALQWIRTMEEPKGMILRWLETLSNNSFTVQFRDGKKHGNADALSRADHARLPTKEEELEAEVEACNSIQLITVATMPKEEVLKRQEEDPDLSKVRQWILEEKKPSRQSIRHESQVLRQYLSVYEFLYLDENQILLRRTQGEEFAKRDRICLPESLQFPTIKVCHEENGGHMGINTTQHRLIGRFYFPGWHRKVEQFIAECRACQRKAGRTKAQRHTLVSIQEGTPMQKLFIDLVGPLRTSKKGNQYILTVQDSFTRWLEAIPINDISAQYILEKLEEHVFSRYGLPEQIHSDQGRQFTSEIFKEVCSRLGVKKTITPAYNPKSNRVERAHKDLNAVLKAITDETEQDWEQALSMALFAMRTARNRHTGVTPFFAMFGREAQTSVDLMYGEVGQKGPKQSLYGWELERRMLSAHRHMRENLQVAVERSRMNYNGKLKGQPLQVGEEVWLFTPVINPTKGRKHSTYWTGPYKITAKLSNVMFRIKTEGTWNKKTIEVVVSIDRLKRYSANANQTLRPQTNLGLEDIVIADEFVEQGAIDPDGLPQFLPPRRTLKVTIPGETPMMKEYRDLGGQGGSSGGQGGAPTTAPFSLDPQVKSTDINLEATGREEEPPEEPPEEMEEDVDQVVEAHQVALPDVTLQEEEESEAEDEGPPMEEVEDEILPELEQETVPAIEQEVVLTPAIEAEALPAIASEKRPAIPHQQPLAITAEKRKSVTTKIRPGITWLLRPQRTRLKALTVQASQQQLCTPVNESERKEQLIIPAAPPPLAAAEQPNIELSERSTTEPVVEFPDSPPASPMVMKRAVSQPIVVSGTKPKAITFKMPMAKLKYKALPPPRITRKKSREINVAKKITSKEETPKEYEQQMPYFEQVSRSKRRLDSTLDDSREIRHRKKESSSISSETDYEPSAPTKVSTSELEIPRMIFDTTTDNNSDSRTLRKDSIAVSPRERGDELRTLRARSAKTRVANDSFEQPPNYLKVAKARQSDDVSRHDPHKSKRGAKRKTIKSSTPLPSDDDEMRDEIMQKAKLLLEQNLLQSPRRKTIRTRKRQPCKKKSSEKAESGSDSITERSLQRQPSEAGIAADFESNDE
jgi:hypothetical protein